MKGEGEAQEQLDRELPWWEVTRFVGRLLGRHPFLLTAVILSGLGVAAAEIATISLLVPFLATLGGSAGLVLPEGFALGFLMPYFAGMDIVQKVRTIAVLLVLVQVVRGGMAYFESRISGYLGILLERDMRQAVFDQLLRVELRYIQQQKSANLFTILHNYPRQTADVAKEYLASLSKGMTFLSLFLVLLATSWQLTLVAIVLGGISTLAVDGLRRIIKDIARRINASRVRLHQVSLESLSAMKVIRLFAREQHTRDKFLREVEDLQRKSFKKASISAAAAPLQRTLNMALFAVLLFVATVVIDQSTDGWVLLLAGFLAIIGRLLGPLGQLTNKRAKIAGDIPGVEAIIAFLGRDDKPYLKEGTRAFQTLEREVRFDGVAFGYEPAAPPVVGPVSFTIQRGSMVALVGESGSGKSTLVSLLARLSDPTSGRILADGVDLRELRSAAWRRQVAVVSQETFLFNATVRENIRFGRLDATDEEVEEAARLANAHEFILDMERGYETLCGDRGVRLSGGQAQRLAIARAILADPAILVLDEATSALDTATERAVQEALDRVSRDRTVVAVAHRLSTVRQANLILVLEKGRIVERGTHEQLMALHGRYHEYVVMQDMGTPMAERVVREVAPHAPLRVLLRPGVQDMWTVANGTARWRARVVPLHEDESSTARLETEAGDVVLVRAGAGGADVRVDGRTYLDIPLYLEAEDGAESRVRVSSVGA